MSDPMTKKKMLSALQAVLDAFGTKDGEDDECPICYTYSHKHWCPYERVVEAIREARGEE